MGNHYRGKHRLIQPYAVRNRIGAATAVIALGLFVPVLTAPTASAAVVNQAYTVPAVGHPDHHRPGGADHRGGDRDRFRGHQLTGRRIHHPISLLGLGCGRFDHWSVVLRRCVPSIHH